MWMTPIETIDVVVLCGGRGKRLKKITKKVPKPMIEIGESPFLDILISYLTCFGFRRFILAMGYKSEAVKAYYKKHARNLNIIFSIEKNPLDTGGAVKKAKNFIKSNPFLVLNGDSFCHENIPALLNFHLRNKALASIVLTQSTSAEDYGTVRCKRDGRIIDFAEKDKTVCRSLINAGIYVFDKKIFYFMPNQKKFSLEKDFFPKMVAERFYGYLSRGGFLDIGTPQRLKKAKFFFKNLNLTIGKK